MLFVIALWVITSGIQHAEASTLANTGLTNVNIGSSTFVSATKTPLSNPKPQKKADQQAQLAQPKPTVAVMPLVAEATPTPTVAQANLDSNKIFDIINAYRNSQGLPPFEKANEQTQMLAQVRSQELIGEGQTGAIHAGLYNRNLPYWIFENAKFGSDEAGTVAWWISSWLHRHSILGDYKYSAVACTQNYCVQLFTSFVAK